ncbi:hypothetical protein B566_EDAN015470 [Ephemera danica]|nr:hypothetical protein B566_EDAN003968 [Ephemera danica]KAF4526317.1 hypothetical protein B566_EDAN015470 [Ephemera danica]
MNVKPGDVVLPGDIADISEVQQSESKLILGPGLQRNRDEVMITKCGVLRKSGNNTYWVDNHQKRYVPARGECVLGVVTNARGEMFRVDIGASDDACISYLAFEGATKKNRPMINVGDVLFAKLLVASKEMEPELVCVDSHGKKGRLGIIPEGGFLFTCSLNLVRKLLHPTCPLLPMLGRDVSYEVIVGMNGKIWVKTKSVRETIVVCNAILSAEFMTQEQIVQLTNKLASNIG